MKFIRWFIGRIILFFDFIFTPRSIKRDKTEQAIINERVSNLSLYQFEACPFCVKVRRAMKRQALPITIRDAKNDLTHRETLLNQGGKVQVPCLRIDNGTSSQWLYESSEIIRYLTQEVVLNNPTPE